MTDRMKNALAHILNASDVDDWAKKVVEDKFVGFDFILGLIQETHDNIRQDGDVSEGFRCGLELAAGLIAEVMR